MPHMCLILKQSRTPQVDGEFIGKFEELVD